MRHVLFAGAVVLIGCGSTDSSKEARQRTPASVEGSYELLMTHIDSEGTLATMGPVRLDIRKTETGYEAAEFAIVITESVPITVTASSLVAETHAFGKLTLPRLDDGSFDGTFTATGFAGKWQGD